MSSAHEGCNSILSQNFKEIQDQFKQAIQNHRLWDREKVVAAIPASISLRLKVV